MTLRVVIRQDVKLSSDSICKAIRACGAKITKHNHDSTVLWVEKPPEHLYKELVEKGATINKVFPSDLLQGDKHGEKS
jgi:hypothetical protein